MIQASDFTSFDEFEKQLDKRIADIAAINDKQPIAECTINSKTAEKYKKLPTYEKVKIVNISLKAILNFLNILIMLIKLNSNEFLNINLFVNSNNNSIDVKTDEQYSIVDINLFINSNNNTVNYSSPADDTTSPSATGENIKLPCESIPKE